MSEARSAGETPEMREACPRVCGRIAASFWRAFGRNVQSGNGKVKIGRQAHGFEALEFLRLGLLALDVPRVFDLGLDVFGRVWGKGLWRRSEFAEVVIG